MRRIIALAATLAISAGSAGMSAADTPPKSCREEAGAATAADYVRDCLFNSPSTHPPCNDANSCEQIVSEVVRACDLGIGDADMCKKYRDLKTQLTKTASATAPAPAANP